MNGPTTRQRRSVLMVGRADATGALSDPRLEVVTVGHWLAALGECARRCPQCVIGRLEDLAGRVETTVQALRELAPQARLLLVTDPSREPQAIGAVEAGFDDYLIEPLRPGELLDAVCKKAPPRSTLPAAAHFLDVEPADKNLAGARSDRLDDEAVLIEHLLGSRRRLADQAVAVIRRKTGCSNLRHADQPDASAGCCLPVEHHGQALGYLIADSTDPADLSAHAAWLGRWLALERQMEALNQLALHDPLTGLWNRRYFDRFLAAIVRRARQDRFRVTLMFFDIDDFKIYNDQYGHPAGDEVLTEIAKLIQSLVRQHDVVARIGGDEFAVIFWDADAPRRQFSEHPRQVHQVARRFQKALCQHHYPKLIDLAPGTLTISGGLAAFPWDGQTVDELIAIADHMLLQSKQQGKNVIALGPGACKAFNDLSDDETE